MISSTCHSSNPLQPSLPRETLKSLLMHKQIIAKGPHKQTHQVKVLEKEGISSCASIVPQAARVAAVKEKESRHQVGGVINNCWPPDPFSSQNRDTVSKWATVSSISIRQRKHENSIKINIAVHKKGGYHCPGTRLLSPYPTPRDGRIKSCKCPKRRQRR
ncbi:uncharacterized protein BDW70DRAFT_130006 [Aspergillus foveolatus]|uniref:uncharacterized protein n=1 Tax=Aspergillus foveolatus TaxID=210207 RepID=UPI003CCDB341